MQIDEIQKICEQFPGVTVEIKWGQDLVFSIGKKMFCVVGVDQSPVNSSFKVKDEEFEELAAMPGFRPAPYVAKYKWVMIDDINLLSKKDWIHYLEQSYELVKAKLPAKIRNSLI